MAANTDLRRLMQLKKSSTRNITHPLAKYNNLEQLMCVICTKVVKDDAVWNAHIQSKKHKENVLLLKSKASSKTLSSSSSSSSSSASSFSTKSNLQVSAKKSYTNEITNKNGKSQLPDDFFDQNIVTVRNSVIATDKPKSILKGSHAYQTQTPDTIVNKDIQTHTLNTTVNKDIQTHTLNTTVNKDIRNSSISSLSTTKEDDAMSNSEKEESLSSSHRKRKADSNLPEDFFDQPNKDVESAREPVVSDGKENAEADSDTKSKLPEGFFDDPKKDAAARNVEYKDPKEKEWEKFQKMIQEETKVAETIQEEEDEESEMHRDLIELNKMKSCLSRVENLKNLICKDKEKKNELRKRKQGLGNDNDGSSGDSDEDTDSKFDWRAKMF